MATKTKGKDEVVEQTAAQATIDNKPVHSKAELMAMAMNALGQMPVDDLTAFFYSSLTPPPAVGDEAGHNADTIKMHPSAAIGMKEELAKIFEGTDVSPDFIDRTTILFEAAVSARVAVVRAELEDEAEKALGEEVESLREELAAAIDGYATYAAEEWLKENQVAVESSVRTELTQDFITGLHELFKAHYVEVPDDHVDVLEALTDKVEDLTDKLDKVIDDNIELSAELTKATMREAFEKVAQGLTVIQKDKFKTMVENVEFEDDLEKLLKDLETIRDANFKTDAPAPKPTGLGEETDAVVIIDGSAVINETNDNNQAKKPVDERVAGYVQGLDRFFSA